ncbi:6-deoxyerythronolide-B synthase EryA1, modules 1 and 2 [Cupriavidus laharis]|uniref:6-deoxyerythronolide-B synthase EryA1, modules 1 and 2 n=1 Tax=Cupriavidus laharis TaxID=151654 RepID=A0ABN7YDH1_9BURK|nr:acyltransferase domain-containing protein [Cupriavidus laharis]CAG9170171.1 6-deoxyerythronolide-B synthase EryA1, modules 1 and 2 [Cupriavidus laharis]
MTRTVIAFSGCTPVRPQPIRSLMQREARFAEMIAQCDSILVEEAGWSMGQLWEQDREVTDLPRNFPLMVTLQIGMFELLAHHGVRPDAVIGMSCGEVSAAYATGAIGLRDALRIAVHGGKSMEAVATQCRMALVRMPAAACRAMTDRISVAAVMAPEFTVISGLKADVMSVSHFLEERRVLVYPLPLPWGVHTTLLPKRHPGFEALVGRIAVGPTRCHAFSTSGGDWTSFDFDAARWWRMFRAPVLFAPGIRAFAERGIRTFIEAGPSSTLDSLLPRLGASAISVTAALAVGA